MKFNKENPLIKKAYNDIKRNKNYKHMNDDELWNEACKEAKMMLEEAIIYNREKSNE